MDGEILFQITKEHLDTGLRGIPVGTCVTSTVHPEKGLFYVERPINEIVDWDPEEVIFLLYKGRKGNSSEITDFKEELKKRAKLSPKVIEDLAKLPRLGDAMRLFSIALLLTGLHESTGNFTEDGLHLIAAVPQIVATVLNNHAGWKGKESRPELGYMENFVNMLGLPNPTKELAEVLRMFDILHFDHGGGNLSTFVGKAVASGLEDMYGSIASAMCALSGPRHGRANQECFHFVQEILASVGENATEMQVEEVIRNKLAKGELIFGFGHAVLRVEDPRATVQYDFAKKHFPHDPLVKIALLIRQAGVKVLKENPKISNPYPNVDAISGVLLQAAGFPYPQYFPVLFGLSRTVGIALQIMYERTEARGGKGTPIVRPKYIFRQR